MTQLKLFPEAKPEHGCDLHQGQRKTLRPLATDRPIHLTLKAKVPFKGDAGAVVLTEARRFAEKFHVKIYDHAVEDDHVHLAVKIPHRRHYVKFIRSLTGLLPRKFGKGFWKQVPYTRVVHLGERLQKSRKVL